MVRALSASKGSATSVYLSLGFGCLCSGPALTRLSWDLVNGEAFRNLSPCLRAARKLRSSLVDLTELHHRCIYGWLILPALPCCPDLLPPPGTADTRGLCSPHLCAAGLHLITKVLPCQSHCQPLLLLPLRSISRSLLSHMVDETALNSSFFSTIPV